MKLSPRPCDTDGGDVRSVESSLNIDVRRHIAEVLTLWCNSVGGGGDECEVCSPSRGGWERQDLKKRVCRHLLSSLLR